MILALVYLVAVAVIVGALATWATNDLNNTSHLASASDEHYAATSATNAAIQSIRYTPVPSLPTTQEAPSSGVAGSPTPVGACWGSTSTPSQLTLHYGSASVSVTVWCQTVITLASNTATRAVTLQTCLGLSSSVCTSPLLTVIVDFDDYSAYMPALTKQCNLESLPCGAGMILQSWIWS